MGMEEYAVDWFLLSLVTAGIAQGKNRSGFNWFFLSTIFGPLALFFLIVFCDKMDNKKGSRDN